MAGPVPRTRSAGVGEAFTGAEVGMCKNGDDIAHGKGFDFPGYHFGPDGPSVAKKTVENFVARAIRPYEQEPGEPDDSDDYRCSVLSGVQG